MTYIAFITYHVMLVAILTQHAPAHLAPCVYLYGHSTHATMHFSSPVPWLSRHVSRMRMFILAALNGHGDVVNGKRAAEKPSAPDDSHLFPSWPPASPREILAHRDVLKGQFVGRKYAAPEGVFEDSPLYYLYRIYEWIMVGHTINMRNELELFWWKRWPVSSIPDPGEHGDPERYAVLSCIPALLVESFNMRIEQGLRREEPHSILALEEQQYWASTAKNLESLPPWVADVQPLETLLHIPHTVDREPQLTSFDDPGASPVFKEKNIMFMHPHIHFM